MSEELFWSLAEPFMDGGEAESGTLMGHDCLRVADEFAAMPVKDGGLVVKLTAERVAELVDAGLGSPFAPAGRTFKEWVLIEQPDRDRWEALLAEAVERARGSSA